MSRWWKLIRVTYSGLFSMRWESQQFFARAKYIWENCSSSKRYLGQTTYLRQSLPWKALSCFSRKSSVRHEVQLLFIVCTTAWNFGRVDKSRGNLLFDNLWQLIHERNCAVTKLAWEPTAVHIAYCDPQLKCFFIAFRHAECAIFWIIQKFHKLFQKLSGQILSENSEIFRPKLNATNASFSIA